MTGAEPLPTDPSTHQQTADPDPATHTAPAPESPAEIPVDDIAATIQGQLSAIASIESIEASLYYEASTMAPLNALSLVGPTPTTRNGGREDEDEDVLNDAEG